MSDLATCVAASGVAPGTQRLQWYPWVARANAEGVSVRSWDDAAPGSQADERVALPGTEPATHLAGCGRWLLLGAGSRLLCWDAGPVRAPPETLGRLPGQITALCAIEREGIGELLAGDDRGCVHHYTHCEGRWWVLPGLSLTAPVRALAGWGRPPRDAQGRPIGPLALCTPDELLFINAPSITHRFPAQDPALLAWCGARVCVGGGGAPGLRALDPASGREDVLLDGRRRRPTALAYDAERERTVAAVQVLNPGLVPTGCELWVWDDRLVPVRRTELQLPRFAHIMHIGWWQDELLLVDQQGAVHREPN